MKKYGLWQGDFFEATLTGIEHEILGAALTAVFDRSPAGSGPEGFLRMRPDPGLSLAGYPLP